jgi:hypothetical protein
MGWIKHDYALLLTSIAPAAREMTEAQSALEHHELTSGAVAEMMAEIP